MGGIISFSAVKQQAMASMADAAPIVCPSIDLIELESFRESALQELESIRGEAVARFGLKSAEIVHRVGLLSVGDNIVAIVCSAAHRDEAFLGCRYIIEELKKRAPIWKKEIGENGERWVGRE